LSEAELHILRARLDGGIRNKAARGELRRGLPVGLVWGEADGEICWHRDEAVTGVITAVFERFAVCGSVRGVWPWLRDQGLKFPLRPTAYLRGEEIAWVEPTYHAVHNVLTHPAYAGADSGDYYEASVALGLAPGSRSHVSSLSYVAA
jgi:hypothetical protein